MLSPIFLKTVPGLKERVTGHSFLEDCRKGVGLEVLSTFFRQYWHLLHNFPDFVMGVAVESGDIAVKSHISKIAYQELGEGNPAKAHENLFFGTLGLLGFSVKELTTTAPHESTQALVEAFHRGSCDYLYGLGILYATETVDLGIVSALGASLRFLAPCSTLGWVDVHVKQEPDHVESASEAISWDFTPEQTAVIEAAAIEGWLLWEKFLNTFSEVSLASKVSHIQSETTRAHASLFPAAG
jgi:pyrroloquinoline quinone (PQQ) biosynthesis protein C